MTLIFLGYIKKTVVGHEDYLNIPRNGVHKAPIPWEPASQDVDSRGIVK